jgi:uncharacterized protein
MGRKIILAGGSGFIGSLLSKYFQAQGDEIIVLSRNHNSFKNGIKHVKWDGKSKGEWFSNLEGADVLINLAGKNVNCRYSKKNKREILESRINSVNVLAEAINELNQKPKVWIQFASATIYRHSEDKEMTEADGEFGEDFSVEVCRKWEECFEAKQLPGVRKLILRCSIVLGRKDGAFPRLLNLVKTGLGGKQGTGNQMVSWIHEDDLCNIVHFLISSEKAGTYNVTSPDPVSNKDLMKTIRKAHGISFGISTPSWLLEIGSFFIGTETELILKSRYVVPEKLVLEGYRFRYNKIESALSNLIG